MEAPGSLFSRDEPTILDGALATYLETLGADVSSALWSAKLLSSNPELIYRAHLDYYRAGAHISITASYQASIPGLTGHLHCSEDDAKQLVKKSVELAQRARTDYLASLSPSDPVKKRRLLVAGSVGPYGAYLANGSEYRGDYVLPDENMKEFHRGRIAALVESGVDILACETMPSYNELRVLAELLSKEFPSTPAWFTFTLRDANHISDGTSVADVLGFLEDYEQVVAVGVNCVPQELALPALQVMRKLTRKVLNAYPNSGEVWNAEKRDWEGGRGEEAKLAELSKQWYAAGASLIGGCCRTGPEDIRTIAAAL